MHIGSFTCEPRIRIAHKTAHPSSPNIKFLLDAYKQPVGAPKYLHAGVSES